jgi:predicted ATPase
MTVALARHDGILNDAIESAGGTVVKTTGDGMMAVFPTPAGAVDAAIAAQHGLAEAEWPETGPLRVRMGINAGDAERRGNDYFGPTINRTARLMAVGHGGQVLLSAAAGALCAERLPAGADLRDLGEYRLRDLGRPERVFQLVHPDLETTFPPLATFDNVASLPTPSAAFVGRRTELEAVERRLEDPAVRLLTLTGPGGTGKTSLAIRAAADQMDRFRDGVSFVDLSAIRDADAVLAAIGRAVGVGEAPARPIRVELAERLRERQVLLVLDNFEQVMSAAWVTTELLDECPQMKLLVTSREPLRVRIEHVFSVPPLGLPPTVRHRVTAAELEPIESIQLFVDRARAVRPEFNVTDDNAAAVAEICRRLDGLPLAIELAAARLRLFSPEALRDRLGSRLELLRSSTRDVPERQQTLRATIEWSYALLEPAEQRVFERLAVFAECDIAAIEAIAAAAPTDGLAAAGATATPDAPIDIIESVASLIEKSLVRQVDIAHGEPRMRMLETIREYATELLDRRPEADSIRGAHATYYADIAGTLKDALTSGDHERALATTKTEVGNLRIAWRYWLAQADLGRLGQLAGSLLTLNEAGAWYQDTVELATDMLALLARTTPTPASVGKQIALRLTLARALIVTRGFTPEVVDAYTQALELYEHGETSERQHYSILRGLANLYMLRSEFDKSLGIGDQIVALADAQADPGMQIDGHLVVGASMTFTGQVRDGCEHLETAIGLFKSDPGRPLASRVGNDPRVACLTTSAFALWTLGFPDKAVQRVDAAIELSDRLGHPYTSAYARFHSGFLHLWRREPELVLDRAIRLQEIADEYDFRIWSAIASCLLGAAQTGLGQLEEGLARSREGMAAYEGIIAPPVFVPMLLFMDAGSRLRAGGASEALAIIDGAIALVGGPDSPALTTPEMNVLRGDVLHDTGATDAARAAWTDAVRVARVLEVRTPELRALTRLVRTAGDEAGRASLIDQLRDVHASFTEGFETADLREAAEVLARA